MNEATVAGLMMAALIGLTACAGLTWWFVWRYSHVTWQDTPEGRHLMRFSTALAVTFTATLVLNVIPLPPIVGALTSVILFGVLAAEMYTRISLLAFAQREERAREERQPEGSTASP